MRMGGRVLMRPSLSLFKFVFSGVIGRHVVWRGGV